MLENPERVTYFAATDARGKRVPFGIKSKDRDRHMYVIGKTGMGKSTLLENMAIQDIRNGEGVAFIDPHGETARKLLKYVPEERINDVVYFAPFDMDYPIAFNVMEDVGYDKRHLVVSGLMATFKKIWQDAWSARMEYILTNTLLALLEYPDATLLGVNRMYTDKAYRQAVVDNVKDPVVKDFWVKEFANYGDRYTQEATPAIQNKIGQFTGNPLIRNIIGQPKSSFDIRDMMDNRKILIMNLSKGLVGETNMRLLGSMLVTRIFLGAMSRADQSAEALAKLPHFYFFVDEFQNFANETFAEILSESRKYKLDLTIAHQYVQQMEEEVQDAVFGNVGTTVAFRVGPFDAETLETVFMPKFTKEDIINLDKRQIYLSLMIDGVGSAPFSAVTIPPIEPPPVSYKDEIVAASRKQFAAPREQVEKAITDELQESLEAEAPVDARMRRAQYGAKKVAPSDKARQAAAGEVSRAPRPTRSQPQPRQEESRPQTRSQPQPRPTPVTKSPEDLRSILKGMTGKTEAERTEKKANQQQSLKGALSDVLKKNETSTPPQPAAPAQPERPQAPQPPAPSPVPEQPQVPVPPQPKPPAPPVPPPAPVERPRPPAPTPMPKPAPVERAPEPPQPQQVAGSGQPFEVPEDTLRKILKGDT